MSIPTVYAAVRRRQADVLVVGGAGVARGEVGEPGAAPVDDLAPPLDALQFGHHLHLREGPDRVEVHAVDLAAVGVKHAHRPCVQVEGRAEPVRAVDARHPGGRDGERRRAGVGVVQSAPHALGEPVVLAEEGRRAHDLLLGPEPAPAEEAGERRGPAHEHRPARPGAELVVRDRRRVEGLGAEVRGPVGFCRRRAAGGPGAGRWVGLAHEDGASGPGGGERRGAVGLDALVAHHHAPEVAPPGPHHLGEVDHEKQDVQDRQDEVDRPRALVAAEERGQPRELRGLVDGEAGEDGAQPHRDHARVGDPLGRVVAPLGRKLPAEVQVVEHHLPGLGPRPSVRDEVPPLAADRGVEHVEHAVQGEQPPDEVVDGHALGEAVRQAEGLVEPVREEGDQGPAAPAESVDVVGPVDEEAAPDHHRQERDVDPVHPPDRAGVLLDGASRWRHRMGEGGASLDDVTGRHHTRPRWKPSRASPAGQPSGGLGEMGSKLSSLVDM